MKIISTAEAAKRLGVTPDRVRKMIVAKRLKAIKVGREWLIDPKDLEAVKNRKVGRPRKTKKRGRKEGLTSNDRLSKGEGRKRSHSVRGLNGIK